jgi:DNA-binding LacI/PurR family transcriptional regulator
MAKQKQTGIRDIARMLNVSPSTVSKAMNGDHSIKSQTRERVIALAREMNYSPNQVSLSLRLNRTKILGIVVPNITSHFFSSIISGIHDAAAREGYNSIICQSNESINKEIDVINALTSCRVDGLIISLSLQTDTYAHIQKITSRGIPLVLFDRTCDAPNVTKIVVDNTEGAYQATAYLIQRGYKRIAHISGPGHLSVSKSRLEGYLQAHRDQEQPVREALICECSLKKEDIISKIQYLLDLPEAPDAIFTINDRVALLAMSIIKSRGMRIPEDIALIGYTNVPESGLLEPALTTVAQPAYEMGKVAADQLFLQIKDPEAFIPQIITLKSDFMIRNSTA